MLFNKSKNIIIYETIKGERPFAEWFLSFKDRRIKDRITKRIDRVKLGNYGDYKKISEFIFELRLNFGKGYRIYFAEDEGNIVLLLCGGDKTSQKKDIKKSLEYWSEYYEKTI
jgi:putative addiction module killer protein